MSHFFIKNFKASSQKHFNWLITGSSNKLDPHLLSIYYVLGSGMKKMNKAKFPSLEEIFVKWKSNGESSVE